MLAVRRVTPLIALTCSIASAAHADAPLFGLASSTLLLQDAPTDQPGSSGSLPPTTVRLSVDPRLTFDADVRGEDAGVLVSHNGVDLAILAPVNPDLFITAIIGGEVSFYDWSGSNTIFPGNSESFEDLYSVRVLLAARHRIDGPWHVSLGGIGRAQGEAEASFEDSLTGGGFLAAGYDFSPRSRIDFGVGVFTRLEDDTLVIPYFNIQAQLTERVRIEAPGLGLSLITTINDQLEFAVKGEVELRDFRLDDSRPAWRDGVIQDLRVPIGVELIWKPLEYLTLALEGGAVVYQEYEFRDASGDELNDIETQPAPFVGLRLEYRF